MCTHMCTCVRTCVYVYECVYLRAYVSCLCVCVNMYTQALIYTLGGKEMDNITKNKVSVSILKDSKTSI